MELKLFEMLETWLANNYKRVEPVTKQPQTQQQPNQQPHCIMGKTRKRSSKFFKLFSCLNSKTGSVDENLRDLDEKSSPLSSPFNDIDSSSPGKPTWPPPHHHHHAHAPSHHVVAQETQHLHHRHDDGAAEMDAGDGGGGCQATPPPAAVASPPSGSGSFKERVRHEYSSTGSIIVTWPPEPVMMTSQSEIMTSQSKEPPSPLQLLCRVNVRL